MSYWEASRPDTGYPDAKGALVIRYHIDSGVQNQRHPSPGQKFSAQNFPREGYIPNNAKGRLVLQLLILAWERRLTFTVGTSTTTGIENCVIWNEIHHKTLAPAHSYPDPNYLDNVTAELAAQGISDADLPLPANASALSLAPPKKSARLA